MIFLLHIYLEKSDHGDYLILLAEASHLNVVSIKSKTYQ